MEEVVTHYINSHQTDEAVHVDANGLALNVQHDVGGRVAIMHSQTYSTSLCRQVSVNDHVAEGQWGEELLDPDCRLAALMAHITQQSRAQLQQPQHKVQTMRSDVDASVILDSSMRLFSGQPLEHNEEHIVVEVPSLPPLPPLQQLKRGGQEDWYTKAKGPLKVTTVTPMVEEPADSVLEMDEGASPIQNKQQSRKSLPHKKRISRKLKRNNGGCTPQQDIVVINCAEDGQQEEILPDNFVTAVQHQDLRPDETHDMTGHEVVNVRPILICQLCGEFYGEDQLKFFHHLKQHYEPHNTIIIENPVSDLGIDKITNSCIVDNVAILPDSIVELSLENSVPKTMHTQTLDKHVLYTTSDKVLSYNTNKVHYTMASMDKEHGQIEKEDLYEPLDMYGCVKCNKSFRRQKQFETHMKEAHSSKLEDMGEFSEPEDLMEGIHVTVDEEGQHYEHTLLPNLTVENGQVHQENTRSWYGRGSTCAGDAYCGVCAGGRARSPLAPGPAPHEPHLKVLKEEVLQRILETDVTNDNGNYTQNMMTGSPEIAPETPSNEDSNSKESVDNKKKPPKRFECRQCGRVFHHRNSLLYHVLSHSGKQHVCRECGKGFYTVTALKVHKRVHNGDRPYKCETCGRDFRQWSDLKYHKVSIHSDQKLFKCEFCGKEFARKYSLNLHRRIHTGERNYKCDVCSKTFRASSYRLSHMRIHTSDKPHKCTQCEKCFRVAADLRRHMLVHEKVRNRLNEHKTKETKDNKNLIEKQDKQPHKIEHVQIKSPKKIAVASTTKMPSSTPINNKINTKKSPKNSKKNQASKKGAPNVTIDQLDSNYTNNVEIFDTREENDYPKYKEVYPKYSESAYIKDDIENVIGYKTIADDRDFAILRPTSVYRNNMLIDNVDIDKNDIRENTDGKMQVYTHVEKAKDFGSVIGVSSSGLGDIRHLEREVRPDVNGDTTEHGFLERLTAMYNIPAV